MLVETDVLARRLGEPGLRIIDCNILMTPKPGGGYEIRSGRDDWEAAHIPGSIYIDLEHELSDAESKLRFMMPGPEKFARVMGTKGISDAHQVVLYSRGANFWATRLYLMFREYGFDDVHILNGGWDRWLAEDRPVTQEAVDWPATQFQAGEPRGHFVDHRAVLAGIEDPNTVIINALSPEIHSGRVFNPPYGRRGRIKGSSNVYCMDLIDPETQRFADADALKKRFAESGALDAERVIVYCGGGISATTDAVALRLLGKEQVYVYDGSLNEWGNNPNLPMETD